MRRRTDDCPALRLIIDFIAGIRGREEPMKNPELDAIARELPRGAGYQIDFIETSTNRPAHYIASAGGVARDLRLRRNSF